MPCCCVVVVVVVVVERRKRGEKRGFMCELIVHVCGLRRGADGLDP